MNYEDFDDGSDKRGFFKKYGFVVGIGVVGLLVFSIVVGNLAKGSKSAPSHMPEVVMIRPLPPPPPPPPKLPDPPKEVVEKMVEQTPIDSPEPKPDDAPKDPSPALTTNLTGSGSDGFGLSRGNGMGYGGDGAARRARSRFGWFAGEVQKSIQDALSRNPLTKEAQFGNRVRIWADASGRVVRVKLQGTTGDPAVDQAIRDALTGLQLQDAPPRDMPMPIVMRVDARRPS